MQRLLFGRPAWLLGAADRAEALACLSERFGIRPARRPCVPLTRDVLQHTLSRLPHLLALRGPGRPFLLFLTRLGPERAPRCVWIDRAASGGAEPFAASTLLLFDDALFDGTVLDGEVLDELGARPRFVVNDLLVHRGKLLTRLNLCRRQWLLADLLQGRYRHDPTAVCDFETRRHWHYGELDDALAAGRAAGAEALVFKSMHLKFCDVAWDAFSAPVPAPAAPPPPPKQPTSSRSSTSSDEDLDASTPHGTSRAFWAVRLPRPDTYVLYDGPVGSDGGSRYAGITTLELSRRMNACFAGVTGVDAASRRKVPCTFNARLGRWIPQLE